MEFENNVLHLMRQHSKLRYTRDTPPHALLEKQIPKEHDY